MGKTSSCNISPHIRTCSIGLFPVPNFSWNTCRYRSRAGISLPLPEGTLHQFLCSHGTIRYGSCLLAIQAHAMTCLFSNFRLGAQRESTTHFDLLWTQLSQTFHPSSLRLLGTLWVANRGLMLSPFITNIFIKSGVTDNKDPVGTEFHSSHIHPFWSAQH